MALEALMADKDETPKATDGESAFERKAWIVAYVVVMLILAAGAARRLMALF